MKTLAGEVGEVKRLQRKQRAVERVEPVGEHEAHQQRRQRHRHQCAEGQRDHARVRGSLLERTRERRGREVQVGRGAPGARDACIERLRRVASPGGSAKTVSCAPPNCGTTVTGCSVTGPPLPLGEHRDGLVHPGAGHEHRGGRSPAGPVPGSGGRRNHSGAVRKCEPRASKGPNCASSAPPLTAAADGSAPAASTCTVSGAPLPGVSWAMGGRSGTSAPSAAPAARGSRRARPTRQLASARLRTTSLGPRLRGTVTLKLEGLEGGLGSRLFARAHILMAPRCKSIAVGGRSRTRCAG